MYQFRLSKIETVQFAIFSDDAPSSLVNLQTSVTFNVSEDRRFLKCLSGFTFSSEDKPFMKLEVACEFELSDDTLKELQNEEGNYIFPVGLQQHFAVITIGTARGVLHERTKGTAMNEFFIPLINLAKFVNKDMVVASK